jgi:hypothetical protein
MIIILRTDFIDTAYLEAVLHWLDLCNQRFQNKSSQNKQSIKFTDHLLVSTKHGHHQAGHRMKKKYIYTYILGLKFQCLTCVIQPPVQWVPGLSRG